MFLKDRSSILSSPQIHRKMDRNPSIYITLYPCVLQILNPVVEHISIRGLHYFFKHIIGTSDYENITQICTATISDF